MKKWKKVLIISGAAVWTGLIVAQLMTDFMGYHDENNSIPSAKSTRSEFHNVDFPTDTLQSTTDAQVDTMMHYLKTWHGNDERTDSALLSSLAKYKQQMNQKIKSK